METRDFGDGPWSVEPDHLQWVHNGLRCVIRRNHSGALCGYVGVDKQNRFYETDYNDVDFDVHGGVTFSDFSTRMGAEESDGDLFWFGFDCAHAGDVVPSLKHHFDVDVYRDIDYVKQQTERLADQLGSSLH